jgi:methylenetetrahydrofolate reductase (NADPH)
MTLSISFEVFPPKSVDGLLPLAAAAAKLAEIKPSLISVTFGAGGSQRDRSFDAIEAVAGATNTPIAGHLTCVGVPVGDVDATIDRYQALGIRHIVALRGDPATGIDAQYVPHPDGYQRTSDLVAAIKRRRGIDVSVSAYPERHPQSPTDDHDVDVLADKVAAGADRAMTQMFFDNDHYLRFRDRVRNRGIDVPIVPGIFPIHSYPAVARFASRCGASMPAWITERFAGLDIDVETTQKIAAELAAEQITDLARHGVDHVHLYTLNRAELALAVCEQLGITNVASGKQAVSA